MPGPSTKPTRKSEDTVFVPHPDDAANAREAFESLERGEVLSAEESEAYLRALLGEDDSSSK